MEKAVGRSQASYDMYEVGRGSRSSGRLKNLGKHFFLKLAANAVRDVASQQDKDGVPYV